MKRVVALLMIMLLSVSVLSAYAQESRPLSKSINDSTFQAASDHIAKWGDSEPIARDESLRDNPEERAKRVGPGTERPQW